MKGYKRYDKNIIHLPRKNHIQINGMLLQKDKKFSALRERRKIKIAEWLYEGFRQVCELAGE